MLAIVWPAISTMTSPFCSPACSAGPPPMTPPSSRPFDVGGVVGNRSREDAHAGAAAAALLLLVDLGELRRLHRVPDAAHDGRRELDDAIEVFVVDLVGGVRRPVVVGVGAGEEAQARHAGVVERRDVGRLIRIRLHCTSKPAATLACSMSLAHTRARAGRLHGQLVVLHAADHVEVQIGRELIERHRRRRRRNAADPIRPSSSPDQKPSMTLRWRGWRGERRADARTAAVPDALSSAPKCTLPASSLPASELPASPWPR